MGSEVSDYRIFVKIPEAWLKTETSTTLLQEMKIFGRSGLVAVVLVTLLVVSSAA